MLVTNLIIFIFGIIIECNARSVSMFLGSSSGFNVQTILVQLAERGNFKCECVGCDLTDAAVKLCSVGSSDPSCACLKDKCVCDHYRSVIPIAQHLHKRNKNNCFSGAGTPEKVVDEAVKPSLESAGAIDSIKASFLDAETRKNIYGTIFGTPEAPFKASKGIVDDAGVDIPGGFQVEAKGDIAKKQTAIKKRLDLKKAPFKASKGIVDDAGVDIPGGFQVEAKGDIAKKQTAIKKRLDLKSDSYLFNIDAETLWRPEAKAFDVQFVSCEMFNPPGFTGVKQAKLKDHTFNTLFKKEAFVKDEADNLFKPMLEHNGKPVPTTAYLKASSVDVIIGHIDFVKNSVPDFPIAELETIKMKNIMEPRTKAVLDGIFDKQENLPADQTIEFTKATTPDETKAVLDGIFDKQENLPADQTIEFTKATTPDEYKAIISAPLSQLTRRSFVYMAREKYIQGGFTESDYVLKAVRLGEPGKKSVGYHVYYTITRPTPKAVLSE
ncbi:hypothetical protein MP638_000206 [Amoeboaphelidium occidentale]|nr:hypothetical protein MP638_000206 [Amoeboaphelidium occidentale]